MGLTKDQIDAIVSHLGVKFPAAKCPVCGQNTWDIQRRVFQLTEYAEGVALFVGGAAIPAVVVVCRTCGNMVLLNAIVLKIVDPDKKNGDQAEESEKPKTP